MKKPKKCWDLSASEQVLPVAEGGARGWAMPLSTSTNRTPRKTTPALGDIRRLRLQSSWWPMLDCWDYRTRASPLIGQVSAANPVADYPFDLAPSLGVVYRCRREFCNGDILD